MKNLIIFLSTFTLIALLILLTSPPANAGGAGGSWGCPDGWTTKADGSCSFDGGGGGTGGGGGGGSWSPEICTFTLSSGAGGGTYSSLGAACAKLSWVAGGGHTCKRDGNSITVVDKDNPSISYGIYGYADCSANPEPEPPPYEPPPPPPPFPDLPPPPPECNVCQQLYNINLKLNTLKNQDITNIQMTINNMFNTINNIDNSITDLSVNQQITNNNLTTIDNSLTQLITNIENNNITNNEIKNIVNNIDNSMTEYSLQLGDIKLALGDIDVKLDNTNKLVLDLKPDIEFIKNNLVNGSPEGKDYTEQLNQIIELLKPCVPTAEKPCPDDDDIVKKLKEIQDFMEADFVPDTDSTAVEVEDLTNIELDRNLIKFGVAQCPPDNEFSTIVNGFSFSGGFKHKPLCDFFTLLSPFIKAFGGFSAALILGGGLRRG